MFNLLKKLFPICRSITGDGVRSTLKIIQDIIPITIYEIDSGTKVFDWVIPNEWNIRDAYVMNDIGQRVIDFKKSNLHILNYSIPFEGKMPLKDLKKHLYTLPEQPDLVPYHTSYYERRWGFCLSHKKYKLLKDIEYSVKIDSDLKPGSLSYADYLIKGKSKKEILISTYICHPSMANNELSGPVIATYLAKYLKENQKKLYYSYRFIFIPETIGAITYLSKNLNHLKKYVIGGYVITCAGDPGNFSYLKTKQENSLTDRISMYVLKNTEKDYQIYDYFDRGSDERQYNSPGIDLNIGSLMRSKYHEYPEYHTSGDNLEFVTDSALKETLEKYIICLKVFEKNHCYLTKVKCEPHLTKYGLMNSLGDKNDKSYALYWHLLAYFDGKIDLLSIAEKIGTKIWDLYPYVNVLIKKNLISRVSS